MKKFCIIICGGGGKTTLFNKYPQKYLDIDYFIWNNLPEYKIKILKNILKKNDLNELSDFYKNEMLNNIELRNDERIILTHHPDNSIWLNRKILKIIRPNKNLHIKNIEEREDKYKKLAIHDWNNLSKYNTYEYNDFKDLESLF